MKLFAFLVSFCLLFANALHAQIWAPIGSGLKNTPTAAASNNSELAVVSQIGKTNNGKIYEISVWDGLSWSALPKIYCDSASSINSLFFYKSELYIGGKFSAFNKLNNPQGVVRWNGKKYQDLPLFMDETSPNSNQVLSLGEHNNLLVVTGVFTNKLILGANNVSFFDGDKWVSSGLTSLVGLTGAISTSTSLQSVLYLGGRIRLSGETSNQYLIGAKTGKPLLYAENQIIPQKLVNNGSSVFFSGLLEKDKSFSQSFYQLRNDSIVPITNGILEIYKVFDIVAHGDTIFACGLFVLDDGNKTEHTIIQFVNGSWKSVNRLSLEGTRLLNSFNTSLVAGGFFKGFSRVVLNNIAILKNIDGFVSGKVFFDKNGNCEYDPREEVLVNQSILVQPGNRILRLSEDGSFYTFLEGGKYTFRLIPSKYFSISDCDELEKTVEIGSGTFIDTLNYALLQKSNINDLSIRISSNTGSRALNNASQVYFLSYKNVGTLDVEEPVIGLRFDGKLKKLNASPPPTSVNGDSATWNLKTVYAGSGGVIKCQFLLESAQNEQLNLNTSIADNEQQDADLENNKSELTQTVKNDIPAISKQVFPNFNANDTSYYPYQLQKVDYQINFSNYTSDTIRTVHVIDTIHINDYVNGIYENASSHTYSYSSIPPKRNEDYMVVIWTFNQINLSPNPDKNPEVVSDDGHIAFSLDLVDDVPIGQAFSNRAHVVFDHNQKQPTQQVMAIASDLGSTSDICCYNPPISIGPNPFINSVFIHGIKDFDYVVHNLLGVVVLNGHSQSNSIELLDQKEGFYFITVLTNNTRVTFKVLKQAF